MAKKTSTTKQRLETLEKKVKILQAAVTGYGIQLRELNPGPQDPTLLALKKEKDRAAWREQAAEEAKGVQENLVDPTPDPEKPRDFGWLKRLFNS